MIDSFSVSILIAVVVAIVAFVASLRVPALFVSLFIAYHLFKSLVRVYIPVLSYSYTIDVSVAVFGLIGAFAHWQRYRLYTFWGRAPKRLFLIYGLLMAVMFLSYPLTSAPNNAIKKLLMFGVMIPFSILIPSLYLQRREDTQSLVRWLFVWGVIASFSTFFLGVNFAGETGAVRMTAAYSSPLLIAEIIAYAGIVSLGALMRKNKLPLLFLPVAFLAFLYMSTRAPVFLLFICALYVLYVMGIKRLWIPLLLFPILGLFFVYLMGTVDLQAGMIRFQQSGEAIFERWAMVRRTLSGTGGLNLIVGGGLANTGYILTGGDEWMYPHNSIIEVWAELGLLGLALILMLFIWPLRAAIKLRQECRNQLAAFVPVVLFATLMIYAVLSSFKMSSFFASFHIWFFITALMVSRERFVLSQVFYHHMVWQNARSDPNLFTQSSRGVPA